MMRYRILCYNPLLQHPDKLLVKYLVDTVSPVDYSINLHNLEVNDLVFNDELVLKSYAIMAGQNTYNLSIALRASPP